MDLGLKNKIAMVGGASKGLGYAVARALAAEGASVSMASRDHEAIRGAAGTIQRETGSRAVAVAADLSTADAIGPRRAASDSLLMSVVRLVRLAVPSMQTRGGGSILVGTSSSVKEPIANLALSNVLRASVSALAKTLSLELAPSRIRVNQLIPGRIETDRVRWLDEVNAKKNGISVGEVQSRALASIPIGRYGQPEDFGRAAAFLLSDAASYITGASVQVDGGLIKGVL